MEMIPNSKLDKFSSWNVEVEKFWFGNIHFYIKIA